ncbi:hypothetical protein [Candidatus Korobacter versatilis]|nr:hypothetical protein [Candidatus Koribacter versatilis]
MKESTALFRARMNFVYRAPSQRFVNMFLRVGSIQRSRQVLDAFFFWMLPFLKGRNALLTDTWSISSIALNAARLLERYWWHMAPEKERRDLLGCRVEMLSAYPDDLLGVMPNIRDALLSVTEAGKRDVLMVLSAVSTGTSLRRLENLISEMQYKSEGFFFLALYRLSTLPDVAHLCDLSSGVSGTTFASIDRGEVGSRAIIEIDRSTYFPLDVKETALYIDKVACNHSARFFSDYRSCGAISIHRNAVDLSNQEHRHHGIYIDVTRMLRHEGFSSKLQSQAASLDRPPVTIITPPHEAGVLLAQRIADFFRTTKGTTVPVFVHPDMRAIAGEVPQEIAKASADDLVLVVDDVSITGQRLGRFQQSLRELKYPGRLVYLVAVARPSSDKSWNRRTQQLSYRTTGPQHRVLCVEKVILPDWNHVTCPWCIETHNLSQLISQNRLTGDSAAFVSKRIMTLERARIGTGLTDQALWRADNAVPLALSPNSLFIPADEPPPTEADVLGSIAAALQQMRIASDETRRLEVNYPHMSLLHHDNYFGQRFNDDILRLGILRCAFPEELERLDGSEEEHRRRLLNDFLLRRDNQESIALELAVARLSRKLPQPEFSDETWRQLPSLPASIWRALS